MDTILFQKNESDGFELLPAFVTVDVIFTSLIWIFFYKGKPVLQMISAAIFFFGIAPCGCICFLSKRSNDRRSKILPLAALYMVIFSFVPLIVIMLVTYSKGFYDCVWEFIVFVPSLFFFFLWVQTYYAIDNWRKYKYPVSDIPVRAVKKEEKPNFG